MRFGGAEYLPVSTFEPPVLYSSVYTPTYHYQSSEINLKPMSNKGERLLGNNAQIADQIGELVKQNAKMERMLARIGSKTDDQNLRNQIETQRGVAKKLTKSIMDLLRHNTGADKAVFNKLKSQFESALKKYEAICEEIEKKQNKVIDAIGRRESKRNLHDGRGRNSSGSDNSNGYQSNRRGGSIDEESQQPGSQQPIDEQDQMIESQLIELDVDEINARKDAVHQIERDVQEVAEMFKDLQGLVNEQQEHIDIIDNNISQAKQHTDEAHTELLQAEEYQKKARRKSCCILFIVLTVVAVIVAIFVINKN
jgi:hypothetical protein